MDIISLATPQEEEFVFTFWLYGPGELPLSYKSSESKGHQTNNNETNCNNEYHSCTVSHIKTQGNFSVKSFNPAVTVFIRLTALGAY